MKLSGRYPVTGRGMNLERKILACVAARSETIGIKEIKVHFEEEDIVLVQPREKYFWEGKAMLLASSSSAWNSSQQRKA